MGDFVNKNKKKRKEMQLKLIDDSKIQKMNFINDFSICVTDFYNGELDNCLKKWTAHLKHKSIH